MTETIAASLNDRLRAAVKTDPDTVQRTRARAGTRPSFSVVIPTYQRREVVCDAVRALSRADYTGEAEVIVVVDGSTDSSAEALAAIHCPFSLIVIEQANGGASAARNRGAALARNDIILFLDDDMIAEPDLLEEHARLYREGADAVIGDSPIDPDSPPGFLAESVSRWITMSRVSSPLSPFDIFTGQLSVRRSAFKELGGFDPALTAGTAFGNEDADFGVDLLARFEVRHNPAAISRQRYVVTPREYMERAARSAAADLQFIRKHPDLARQLFDRKGMARPLIKWVCIPLTRISFLAKVVTELAVRTANWVSTTPFRSNRMVARFFSGARTFAYWSALRTSGWLPFSESVSVLCYHGIEDQSDDPVLASYGVPPERFANQLDSLTKRGFSFVTPGQLVAFLQSNAPLPRRPVLLTFDDGHAALLRVAQNVLKPRGIEALAFVVTGIGSGTNEWDQAYGAKPIELLTNEERIELASLGVEIGSHSRTHREMPLLTDEERRSEAYGSSSDLVSGGLPRPRFFAYPFGARDKDSRKAVAEAGFRAAFGLIQRRMTIKSDRFDLPRIMILSSDHGRRFWMKTTAPRMLKWCDRGQHRLGALLRRLRTWLS